jgi:GNAT superfamily N-acetyltransferase
MQSIDTPFEATRVSAGGQAKAIGALTLAFASDPMCRWCWPRADDFLKGFPAFTRAFGGRAFVTGSAYQIAGGAGAALWLPPDVEPDEAGVTAVIQDTVPAGLRESLYSVMEQMGRHHPIVPHWYLPLIGVEPVHQGLGLGYALMQPILQRCDAEGLPAYLESTNPRNIPFYERLRFRRVGVIRAGTSPAIVPMVREAQA